MNVATSQLNTNVNSKPDKHLLDAIRAIREIVGDGLNDIELTRFLRNAALPTEAGFAFLSFSERFVTLSVPQQDLADWYPEKGWIAPEKERIVRAIAEKYELSFSEPPDQTFGLLCSPADSPTLRHHLELTNRWETVIVAHPSYLKVRMLGSTSGSRLLSDQKVPLLFGPELLQDLSALYQA